MVRQKERSPKLTGNSALDLSKWKFNKSTLTELEKKLIVSMVVECAILTVMTNHVYTFAGKYYLQDNGGPIGLNSTASLSSIVMG